MARRTVMARNATTVGTDRYGFPFCPTCRGDGRVTANDCTGATRGYDCPACNGASILDEDSLDHLDKEIAKYSQMLFDLDDDIEWSKAHNPEYLEAALQRHRRLSKPWAACLARLRDAKAKLESALNSL